MKITPYKHHQIGRWHGYDVYDVVENGYLIPSKLKLVSQDGRESRITEFDETLEILATMESEE